MSVIRRREFVTLLGGAAAGACVWPLSLRAQQGERMRRIAVLAGGAGDEDRQERNTAFVQALQNLGWTVGRNVQIDYRTASGGLDALRRYAAEIVALAPDVILTSGSVSMAPLLRATRTIPIVFTNVADPVGAGFVKSLSKPGGNVTGFMQAEYDLSGKWLELLKQIVPSVTRAAVLRDPEDTAGIGQFAVIQSVARSVGVEVSPINVRDTGELESIVADFARSPNGGLVVTASAPATIHRKLIISTAARHKLPAIYPRRLHVADGGLMSYGSDVVDMNRRAASYVDRILKGEKPIDLPVQAPTRYELVINLKTAQALGITVPATLLARTDEVIE
jgi:putative tryptophan/tyrosine transport system substrate-binding protein